MTWEVADTRHPERPGPRYPRLADAARVVESANTPACCVHCGAVIEQDDAPDGTWYHPGTMTARCDGPDDEMGLSWGDMVRQAEPRFYLRWLGTEPPAELPPDDRGTPMAR